MEIIIKSQETRDGVRFRILKDDKFVFAHVLFNNYFYVRKMDYEANMDDFHKTFKFGSAIKSVETFAKFSKIVLANNWLRVKVREFWEFRCKTFEADVKADKRFLLDKKPKLNNEHIPYTFFDIETDDRLPLQKDKRGNVTPGNARILSFSGVDWKDKKNYFELEGDNDESERVLLKQILSYFANYGIISGWNSEHFDSPYIKGRCDALNINYDILDYINHLDYMELLKKYSKKSLKSYSLNNVANVFLGESKVDQAKGNGAIYNTWKNNKAHLMKYNIEDSNLIYKLNKDLMFIEVCMKRADNAGCHVRSTMWNSDSGDYLLMRGYQKRSIIMPSKPTKDEILERLKQGKISGGYTRCLKPGYYPKVHVWDYKSFYPSVIRTFNIDPTTYVETLGKDHIPGDIPDFNVTPSNFNEETQRYHGPRVYKKAQGVVPAICEELTVKRDKIKYTMEEFKISDPSKYRQLYLEQYALKTDANSIYGILADPKSRYYSWNVGDSVTTGCQAIIKASYEKLIEWGCDVIGGDTDSTFVILPEGVTPEEINKRFIEFYKEYFKRFNIIKHYIVFEFEKIFEPMLFVKKKNYAFKVKGVIGIKGLEAIKSDSSRVGAKLQEEFINDLFGDKYDKEHWEDKVAEICEIVHDQELKADDLILAKGLTKMPDEYKGYVISKVTGKPKIKKDGSKQEKSIPAHVQLAKRLMEVGVELYPGSKIRFIVIKDKPILAVTKEEYIKGTGTFNYKFKKHGWGEYEWEGGYEADYYWNRIIKPLIKVVYTYYGNLPDWEWNLTDSQINKLIGE